MRLYTSENNEKYNNTSGGYKQTRNGKGNSGGMKYNSPGPEMPL